ncbi:thiol:disulfide interchange protein DsbA/DsbL [Azonexus sp.]|uniref:thiol:disulfide interchange protein DsbA/DsbL n=1 Tax=Azonexus sp. TaxID=1872668 RepID=UPI0039E5F143
MYSPDRDRRHFLATALALGAASASPLAWAQAAAQEFVLLKPAQPTEDAGKIEVLEFFSYGCPHCADFNPLLTLWAEKLPGDVVLKKVPVSFGRAAWGNAAKLFYALQTTGDLKRLEDKVFQAIHKERNNLFEEKSIKSWVAAQGVDAAKFAEAFSSFGVQSKVRRGDQLAHAYKIEGVPALAVNGKYLVGSLQFEQQLAVADKLIAQERRAKGGK